jgi:hypothetical protein
MPITTKQRSAEAAHADGFATFNGYEHLCIDAADTSESFTIAVRLNDGTHATFSVLASQGRHFCIDIHHDAERREFQSTALAENRFILDPGEKRDARLRGSFVTLLTGESYRQEPATNFKTAAQLGARKRPTT